MNRIISNHNQTLVPPVAPIRIPNHNQTVVRPRIILNHNQTLTRVSR
ncbi:MAG TPA: hypothetical protein VHC97_28295 [Thermoanaerobaculia bacterium]|jgi:hypothetical protein|nr:hypothetical protein [Thermoanaerobaculia bacterium]